MPQSNSITEFSAFHLGRRLAPDDLCRLLDLRNGSSNVQSLLRFRFLQAHQRPAIVNDVCLGRNNLNPVDRFAHAQAIADMLRYIGFVAEDDKGGALGYWFGPSDYEITAAPIVRLNLNCTFAVLQGSGITEAISIFAAHGDERLFTAIRGQLEQLSVHMAPTSLEDAITPICSPTPQMVFENLLATYQTDLVAATPPDFGTPVQILATERGPKII